MSREVQVRFCESRGVRFPPATHHLLGFIGPKAEAEQIKASLAAFLRETLALELNPDKTLITHARSGAARFLGYDITVQHCDTKLTGGCRSANGRIALRVPLEVITAKYAPYRHHGTPWHRPRLQNLPDYDIVRIYGAEYRGIVNYYLLAQNVGWLSTRISVFLTSSERGSRASQPHSRAKIKVKQAEGHES